MKQLFLADYVIVTMATSAILIIISYMLLAWTNRTIPTDLIALLGSFGGGSVMSTVFKATGLKQESKVKLSTVDYALLGLALAMITAVINYNLLIWAGREIPSQMIVAINTMVTIVVSGTTFRNSNTVTDDLSEDVNKNN